MAWWRGGVQRAACGEEGARLPGSVGARVQQLTLFTPLTVTCRRHRSHSRALKLFTVAAELKDPDAQCNLAAMHANGQGCHKNLEQARAWFSVAAEQGAHASVFCG